MVLICVNEAQDYDQGIPSYLCVSCVA